MIKGASYLPMEGGRIILSSVGVAILETKSKEALRYLESRNRTLAYIRGKSSFYSAVFDVVVIVGFFSSPDLGMSAVAQTWTSSAWWIVPHCVHIAILTHPIDGHPRTDGHITRGD